MGTIQLDRQQPERLECRYVGADNAEQTPYVVHRALFGSFERFIGILVEHYAGAFPFWLAPVQVRVIPVGEDHRDAAKALATKIPYRVEVDDSDETVGKRIRNAEVEKIPYVVVYGDRESEDSLAIRERGGEQSTQVACGAAWRNLVACEPASRGGICLLTFRADGLRGGSTESKDEGPRPLRCLQTVLFVSLLKEELAAW